MNQELKESQFLARKERIIKQWDEIFEQSSVLLFQSPEAVLSSSSHLNWAISAFKEYLGSNPALMLNIIGQRKYKNVTVSIVHFLSSTAIFFLQKYQDLSNNHQSSMSCMVDNLDDALEAFSKSPKNRSSIISIMEGVSSNLGGHQKYRAQLLMLNLFVALVSCAELEADTNDIVSRVTKIFKANLEGADNYRPKEVFVSTLGLPDFSYEPLQPEFIRSILLINGKKHGIDRSDHIIDEGDKNQENSENIIKHLNAVKSTVIYNDNFIQDDAFTDIYQQDDDGKLKQDTEGKYIIETELKGEMNAIRYAILSRSGISKRNYDGISMIIKTTIGMVVTYGVSIANSFTSLSQMIVPISFYSSNKIVDYASNILSSYFKSIVSVYNEIDDSFHKSLETLLFSSDIYPQISIDGANVKINAIDCSHNLQSILRVCAEVHKKSNDFQSLAPEDKSAVSKIIFTQMTKKVALCSDSNWLKCSVDKLSKSIVQDNGSASFDFIPNYRKRKWLEKIEGSIEDALTPQRRTSFGNSLI